MTRKAFEDAIVFDFFNEKLPSDLSKSVDQMISRLKMAFVDKTNSLKIKREVKREIIEKLKELNVHGGASAHISEELILRVLYSDVKIKKEHSFLDFYISIRKMSLQSQLRSMWNSGVNPFLTRSVVDDINEFYQYDANSIKIRMEDLMTFIDVDMQEIEMHAVVGFKVAREISDRLLKMVIPKLLRQTHSNLNIIETCDLFEENLPAILSQVQRDGLAIKKVYEALESHFGDTPLPSDNKRHFFHRERDILCLERNQTEITAAKKASVCVANFISRLEPYRGAFIECSLPTGEINLI